MATSLNDLFVAIATMNRAYCEVRDIVFSDGWPSPANPGFERWTEAVEAVSAALDVLDVLEYEDEDEAC